MIKSNKRRKHAGAILLITAALLAVAGGCSRKQPESGETPTGEVTPEAVKATGTPEPTTLPEPTVAPVAEISEAQPGNIVRFGSYEQDNDTENGAEAIEWLVLDKQDGKLLLLSQCALDSKRYNEEYVKVTWETCTLREWLNDTFYHAAFDTAEQGRIATTMVRNGGSSFYDTDGGNDTEDKIFLLSFGEAVRYFEPDPVAKDPARRARVTAYAEAQGGYVSSSSGYAGNGWWWLRTPGYNNYFAAVVNSYGNVYYGGFTQVNFSSYVVRPALWLNTEE